jgi:hypothetical protein
MLKASITNNITGQSFAGIFPDQPSLTAWLEKEVANGSFGKPARWASYTFGDPLPGFTETRQSEGVTEYFYQQEFTVVQSDATAEVAAKAAAKKAFEEVQKGLALKMELQTLLKTKIALGQVTLEQASAFVESDEVKKVERYLGEGYLGLVKPIMEAGTFSLLTPEEKASFIAKI